MSTLVLAHISSDKLNLYGDRGNVMILKKRCEWRGITLRVREIYDPSPSDLKNVDMIFIGGGSDREQALCTEGLRTIKHEFKSAIEDGVGGITICGGYQFLGSYYELPNGDKLKGLDILQFYTINKNKDIKKRLIGDLHVVSDLFGRIVGYENHSGQTFHDYDSLGTVVKGYGNNKKSKTEGLLYKNLIGTYLHGPLLSKNPRIADWLIEKALLRKYGVANLSPLDDEFANKANDIIWNRCIS